MDVSNSTGRDTDYKLTSGGGTRGPRGWQRLPGGSRVRQDIDMGEGPWKIEFRVPRSNGDGVQTVSGSFSNPKVHIVLLEGDGTFSVDVHPVA